MTHPTQLNANLDPKPHQTNSSGALNDLHVLDMRTLNPSTWMWQTLQRCTGDVPCARQGHAACAVDLDLGAGLKKRSMLVFGGLASQYLNDVYSFEITATSAPHPGRPRRRSSSRSSGSRRRSSGESGKSPMAHLLPLSDGIDRRDKVVTVAGKLAHGHEPTIPSQLRLGPYGSTEMSPATRSPGGRSRTTNDLETSMATVYLESPAGDFARRRRPQVLPSLTSEAGSLSPTPPGSNTPGSSFGGKSRRSTFLTQQSSPQLLQSST